VVPYPESYRSTSALIWAIDAEEYHDLDRRECHYINLQVCKFHETNIPEPHENLTIEEHNVRMNADNDLPLERQERTQALY
jgi:hypothetical protein